MKVSQEEVLYSSTWNHWRRLVKNIGNPKYCGVRGGNNWWNYRPFSIIWVLARAQAAPKSTPMPKTLSPTSLYRTFSNQPPQLLPILPLVSPWQPDADLHWIPRARRSERYCLQFRVAPSISKIYDYDWLAIESATVSESACMHGCTGARSGQ